MRFRDLFSILVIGLVTVFVGRSDLLSLNTNDSNANEINREDATRSKTVLLNKESWVEFQVPAHASNIRLLTNAAVVNSTTPQTTYDDPRIGWRYAIEYELLDSNRNVIKASDYHFRSRVKQFIDSNSGEIVCPMFFGKTALVSTQTRVMQLAIGQENENPDKVAIIRLKVHSMESAIKEVVARVTSRVERQDFQKRYTWNRLTQSRREKVCQYCVYNYSLLSESERSNLMRWQWTIAPTVGQFESRMLYSLGNIEEEQLDWQAMPIGQFAKSDWLVNIPIPEGSGMLRIQVQPLDHGQADPQDPHIQVRWVGDTPSIDSEKSYSLDSSPIELAVNGGQVQVSASADVVLRAYWRSVADENSEEIEITPKPILIRAFLADERPVDFAISHFRSSSTPFQISVRQVYDDAFFQQPSNLTSTAPSPEFIVWEFLDQGGQVTRTGQIPIDSERASYDHLWIDGRPLMVSNPSTFYFSVPSNVNQVRIRTLSRPLLVSGSARPDQLARVTQVPEDYQAFTQSNPIHRTWFSLQPESESELVRNNRSFFIRSQIRIKERDPQIAAGNYTWKRYVPKGKWIGRRMLVPVSDMSPVREQADQSVYSELKPNHPYPLTRQELPLSGSRKIIFVGADSPGDVNVYIDEKKIYSKRILSRRGQIEIEEVAFQNATSLQIESDSPTRFFINGPQIQNTSQFRNRTAQRLDNGILEFVYDKKSVEALLSLKLFRGGPAQKRCKVGVTIEPESPIDRAQTPSRSWTVLNRVYDLRSSVEHHSVLLDSAGKVDIGHQCFIKLGEDLPQGQYRIRVRRMDQTSGYALLYQTIPDTLQHQHNSLSNHPQKEIQAQQDPGKQSKKASSKKLDQQLRKILAQIDQPAALQLTTPDELQHVQELFVQTLASEQLSETVSQQWAALGWRLTHLEDHNVVVIHESQGNYRGRGVYAFRKGSQSQLTLQAPHRFFDERTGSIARKLFSAHDIQAVCWNSAHRKKFDIAHQKRSHFNAFMSALANVHPETSFIQLHGFDASSRTGLANSAQLIVSDSTRHPARHARLATIELKQTFGKSNVRLYPQEVKTLGGTKNSQASILRSGPQSRFLHVEMSAEFRKAINNSASKRADFVTAITQSVSNSGD